MIGSIDPEPSSLLPSPLGGILRDEIGARGPIPFRRFMELALYHPQHGYYASGRARIGRRGDYFTSVSAGPLFGRLLAAQLEDIRTALGVERLTVVEQGAGNGDLAADILAGAARDWPGLALDYLILEPFPVLRELQRSRLKTDAPVRWIGSIEELPELEGVHVSNELLDAFPVHLVRKREGFWRELHVETCGSGFDFCERPLSGPELGRFLARLPADLPEGYQTEVNLESGRWIDAVAGRLRRGVVLAIDYGFPRARYYEPERTEGTLSCYSNHRRSFDPLERPGELDLTAHVDFTTLAEQAAAAGLRLAGFTDQHHFVVALAEVLHEHTRSESPFDQRERRNFNTLMHPDFLGMQFKAMALSRGLSEPGRLAGLRHSRSSGLEIDDPPLP